MSRPFTEDIEGVLEQSERPRLQDTQPRDETRKRSMEFDQPGEEELEAAGGGEEVNVISGVEELPDLRPEQQLYLHGLCFVRHCVILAPQTLTHPQFVTYTFMLSFT